MSHIESGLSTIDVVSSRAAVSWNFSYCRQSSVAVSNLYVSFIISSEYCVSSTVKFIKCEHTDTHNIKYIYSYKYRNSHCRSIYYPIRIKKKRKRRTSVSIYFYYGMCTLPWHRNITFDAQTNIQYNQNNNNM